MTNGHSLKRSTAYIGLGGNLGEPAVNMAKALRALDADELVDVVAVSSLYRTPPWGKTDQPDFLNAAARLDTGLGARALLDRCLEVERQLKRVRDERWGPRLIDIDILWFEGRSISENGLVVPHPRMLDRAFVLLPLAEIAPDLELGGVSAAQRGLSSDRSGIERIAGVSDWLQAR